MAEINKNIEEMTLAELQESQKKLTRSKSINAGIIGFCGGGIAYSIYNNGFKLLPLILFGGIIFLIMGMSKKQEKELERVKELLKTKN